MKNVLKTIGIICIITAAFLIAACGPGIEPDVDTGFTVTFDSDGGSAVSSQYFTKDDTKVLTKPANPTKTNVADPGLYKNWPATGYTFAGWFDSTGAPFSDWNAIPTASITLKAKWTIPANAQVDLGTITGNDIVTPAFTKINSETPGATDKYILYIDSEIQPAGHLTLTKAYANLTILGESNNTSEIKSPNLSTGANNVFITIGTGANPQSSGTAPITPDTTGITLTLKNVAVVGSGFATPNSLIRVINGGTLTLDEKAYISGHESSGDGSGGDKGNGSAICVINGSTLNIKQSATVEKNKATSNQDNRNLVAGIFVHGNPQAPTSGTTGLNKSTVNIEGGIIKENTCTTDGNTGDIYITELVDLNLQGNVTIDELCLNSDDSRYPVFIIKGSVTNKIKKLNLRSTGSSSVTDPTALLTNAKTAWTGTNAKIFSGTASYDITDADVSQFELWEFTARRSLRGTGATDDSSTWANLITKFYEIELVKTGANPNYGKLKTK